MKKVLFAVLSLVFLVAGVSAGELKVPKGVKDPFYGVPVKKYGNLACEIELKNGKKIYFASVKSMMDFYYRPWFYNTYGVKTAKDIKKMLVQDYITGKLIDAHKAHYVFGSRLVGAYGDDVIPFIDKTTIKLFEKRYGGTKVLPFYKLTKGLIKFLDKP